MYRKGAGTCAGLSSKDGRAGSLGLAEHPRNLDALMSCLVAPLPLLQAAGWFGIFTSAYAFYLALAFLFEVRRCSVSLGQQLSRMAGAAAGLHGWRIVSASRPKPLANIGHLVRE